MFKFKSKKRKITIEEHDTVKNNRRKDLILNTNNLTH